MGIGLGLLRLRIPLAVLAHFGGLFPIVGAAATGMLAVLIALAYDGLFTAALVRGLVLLVQQLESNMLQPLILGNALGLHPLMIVLAVAAGALALGAFIAVPIAAIAARRHGAPEARPDDA